MRKHTSHARAGSAERWKTVFGVQDKSYRPSRFSGPQRPIPSGDFKGPNVPLVVGPAHVCHSRQQLFRDCFSGHMLYKKAVSRPHKGFADFCFVVTLTLQNHAVTGYAGLFAGFEKIPHFMRVCGEAMKRLADL